MLGVCNRTFREAYLNTIETILEDGKVVPSRDGGTLELHPFVAEITDPTKRQLLCVHRGNDPFATLAETIWVLSGSRRIEWLEKFLPRCKDYSDDGKMWRAGYGNRIRSWLGMTDGEQDARVNEPEMKMDIGELEGIDQIQYIFETLKEDPESRRAIISIWDPAKECTIGESRDFPCCNLVHFMIRDNKLDCELFIRSNDVVFGFGSINVYEWTVLQEILANALGVDVGSYFHIASSMHLYFDRHYTKARKILKANQAIDYPPSFKFNFTNVNSGQRACTEAFNIIEELYMRITEYMDDPMGGIKAASDQAFFIANNAAREIFWFLMLRLLWQKDGKSEDFYNGYERVMEATNFTDLKAGCDFWLRKKLHLVQPHELAKSIRLTEEG